MSFTLPASAFGEDDNDPEVFRDLDDLFETHIEDIMAGIEQFDPNIRITRFRELGKVHKYFRVVIFDKAERFHDLFLVYPKPNSETPITGWKRFFSPNNSSHFEETDQLVEWLTVHFESMGFKVPTPEMVGSFCVIDSKGIAHTIFLLPPSQPIPWEF